MKESDSPNSSTNEILFLRMQPMMVKASKIPKSLRSSTVQTAFQTIRFCSLMKM